MVASFGKRDNGVCVVISCLSEGMLQSLDISKSKWDNIAMDFVVGLPRNQKKLEDLLRGSVLEHAGSWNDFVLLIEFTCNNNFNSSIGMTP